MIKIRRSQKPKAEEFIMKFVCQRKTEVTNPLEHKIAENFIKEGIAKATKKKNYGRIAEIENLEYQPM